MPLFRRKWNCAVCHKPVIYDSDKKKLSCGCRVIPNVNLTAEEMEAFEVLPKFDRKIWKETLTVPLDCAKYLDVDAQVLHISDRESIFKGNENPHMRLRWIHYPEKDKIQLCLEIDGEFHTEKISYNRKNPNSWKGRMWIFLDPKVLPEIIEYLRKDPQAIHSWM